jgi:hypothetical protein
VRFLVRVGLHVRGQKLPRSTLLLRTRLGACPAAAGSFWNTRSCATSWFTTKLFLLHYGLRGKTLKRSWDCQELVCCVLIWLRAWW